MKNIKFSVFYDFSDIEKAPPALSLEEQQAQMAKDFFFGPIKPEVIKSMSSRNTDLNTEAVGALLTRESALRAFIENINSGNGDFRELQKMGGLKVDGLELSALMIQAAAKKNLSIFGYLNSVFGTNITPDTKISVDGGTMTLTEAFVYVAKKDGLLNTTKANLQKVKP